MTSNTAKKLVVAVVVTVFGAIGVAAPAEAGPQQKVREIWCC